MGRTNSRSIGANNREVFMSRTSNEWVRLEMREGIFKDKSPRFGRVLFFLCMFVFLFLWSVPVSTAIHTDNDAVASTLTHDGKMPMLTSGDVDNQGS